MGEITNTPLSKEFLQKLERDRRKEIAKQAEVAFFRNVIIVAAQGVAEEIAGLTKFKEAPCDDVVYYNARKYLESYLSDNLEIKSAMFVSNANRPDKVIQGLAAVALERYQKNPKSFHLSEVTA